MSLQITHNQEKMRFEVSTEAGMALCEYQEERLLWIFTHTEVPEALQGRGIAAQLVGEALRQARASGRKVRPLCRYVAAYIQRHAEFSDLLD